MNNCFSIYHTRWITSGPKSNFICENIATKAILFFFSCSGLNSTWLITSELANQHARKVLFTCVVYTNRYYGLLPLMVALTCTLKFGLKWSYLQNIFANPFEFYVFFYVSLSRSFCGCAQNRFGTCRYHTGIFTQFCKVGHEKKWAGKWDCYTSQKLSSFHSRKNCECFYCTSITIPIMYNNYCRQYLLHVGLFWFHLSLYKSYLLFYSSLL